MKDAARRPFTDTAWSSLGSRGLTRETAPRGWERLHDLTVEAHETTRDYCHLTFEDWRALVSAAATGLPVYITHEHRNVPGEGTTERTTRAYVVDTITGLSPGVYDNLRTRAWGFSVPMSLSELVSVTVPEATYEYRTEEEV